MQYSFNSRSQHNFRTLFTRYLPRFIWPVIAAGVIQLFFPATAVAKNNFHYYFLLLVELSNLYQVLTDDSVNCITIDVSKRNILFSYYNIYEGNAEKLHPFSVITIDICTGTKGVAEQISFFIKKKREFTVKKEKDQFLQEDITALNELLTGITSPKSI